MENENQINTDRFTYIYNNVSEVVSRIKNAAADATENAVPVTLLAAIKSADINEVNYLHRVCGINDLGENRVQQLISRYNQIADRENLRLHFIGKLQRNKVKYIIDKVDMIHSVDSTALADEISLRAARIGKIVNVLIEINIGKEEKKSGVMPNDVAEVAAYVDKLKSIRLCGFMTMAPICENVAEYRKYFSLMRELSYSVWHDILNKDAEPELSMGMSESFEAAIAEGATIIRIGRHLFQK